MVVADWLRDVGALCVFIRHALAPQVAAKLVTLVDRDFLVTEPVLGTYSATGLEVSLVGLTDARVAVIRPWGLSILGAVEAGVTRALNARGRVDIECGAVHAILLRFEGSGCAKWVAFFAGDARSFDEKVLFELISRVTEVKDFAPSRRTSG